MKLTLRNLMISSEDPSKLVDFYNKVLGEPSFDVAPFTGWVLGEVSIMVGPHDQVKGKNKEPGRLIFFLETSDVEGEFKRVKELGAEVVSEPTHPGGDEKNTLACLADPDGNYFQFATPMNPGDM